MKRRISLLVATAALAGTVAFPALASAHNRALIWLPTGVCVQVGGLNYVFLGPDKIEALDLDPNVDGDNFGTSWAFEMGNTPLEKGACP